MAEHFSYETMVSRNFFIISNSAQNLFKNLKVAIAGLGAEGSIMAMSLARIGFQKFNLADNDIYETSNINRQIGANIGSIGQNKAWVVAEMLKNINPYIEFHIFSEGVDERNAEMFVEDANILIDAIDIENPKMSKILNTKARKCCIPTFAGVSIGFGANIFVFGPRENQMSMSEFLDLGPLPWVPIVPAYIKKEDFAKVLSSEILAPVIMPGVLIMGALFSTLIINYLTGENKPPIMPIYTRIDLMENIIEERNILKDLE